MRAVFLLFDSLNRAALGCYGGTAIQTPNFDRLARRAVVFDQRCIDLALEFLDRNAAPDGWLLQVETFDPHEPSHAPARFREAYPTAYHGPTLDWPRYREVLEQPEEIAELRANYAAVVALCDEQLGRLLDRFDEQDLWKSTALVLTTDHGFLLGEHDLWGKTRLPCYDEVAHITLLIWHPNQNARAGERRQALTQTINLMPTFLDLFGVQPPVEVRGRGRLGRRAAGLPSTKCSCSRS